MTLIDLIDKTKYTIISYGCLEMDGRGCLAVRCRNMDDVFAFIATLIRTNTAKMVPWYKLAEFIDGMRFEEVIVYWPGIPYTWED